MNRIRTFILIWLLLAFLTLPGHLLAFKPGTPPSLPQIWIDTLTCKAQPEFDYLVAYVEVTDTGANVALEMGLTGVDCDSILLNSFLRLPKIIFEVNGEKFAYTDDTRKFHISNPESDSLHIKTEYHISTRYTFQGPPGPWVRGNLFELTSPFFNASNVGEKLMPQEISVEVLVPSDFEFEGEIKLWEVEDREKKTCYSLRTPVGLNIANRWVKMDQE